jgi:hypothetical protein
MSGIIGLIDLISFKVSFKIGKGVFSPFNLFSSLLRVVLKVLNRK